MAKIRLCVCGLMAALLISAGISCSGSKAHVPTKEEAAKMPLPPPPAKNSTDRAPPPPPVK